MMGGTIAYCAPHCYCLAVWVGPVPHAACCMCGQRIANSQPAWATSGSSAR